MTTAITLTYDPQNNLATRTLDYILSLGVFNTKSKKKTQYNADFVQKIKSQEGVTGIKINIDDLWK